MARNLRVVDYSYGRSDSRDVDTNVPFTQNYEKTRTIQQANVVIGAYVNKNYEELQELKNRIINIPEKTSDLTNDGSDGEHPFITNEVDDLVNYTNNDNLPNIDNLTNYTKTEDLSTVATTGDYDDLLNKPTIPSTSNEYGTSTTNGYSQNYINNNYVNKSNGYVKEDLTFYANDFKCRNLFNYDTCQLASYINDSGVIVTGSNPNILSEYIEVTPNTKYTISASTSIAYIRVHEFNSSKVWTKRSAGNSVSNMEVTTDSTTKYIRVTYNLDGTTTMTPTVLKTIYAQIEKGNLSPYTPYKPIGEQIYSTSEIRIGTWIDGKPLYQKSFKLNVNVTSSDTNIINLSTETPNYEHLWIDESHSFMEVSNQSLPLNWYSSASDYIRTSVSYQTNYVRTKGTTLSNVVYYVTLLYTKTTD